MRVTFAHATCQSAKIIRALAKFGQTGASLVDLDATTVLVLVFLLQVKHLVADFFLQNEYMLSGRDRYLHGGRALHVALHIVGTVLVLVAVGTPIFATLVVAIVEFVLHYHIDWGKSALNHRRGLTPSDPVYWRALGVDQALHHATYIAIAGALLIL